MGVLLSGRAPPNGGRTVGFAGESRAARLDHEERQLRRHARRVKRLRAFGDACREIGTGGAGGRGPDVKVVRKAGMLPASEDPRVLRKGYVGAHVPWDGGGVVQKAPMAESSGGTGGYLVPEHTAIGVELRLQEVGVFHRKAYRQPMLSATCPIPAIDLNKSHATGTSPLLGGMQYTWTGENKSGTESEPSFAAAQLVAHDLIALVYVSNQLVMDGGEALGTYLERVLTVGVEWAVEYACFQGSGVGQPMGIVNSAATATVTRAGGGAIATGDVAAVATKIIPACRGRCVWVASPTAMAQIETLSTYFLNQESRGDDDETGLAGLLLGRPLYTTEKLPALGTRGDLVLFDPRMYALGTRSLSIERGTAEQTAFYKNQTVFRVWWRGDGQPIPRGTCTLADGTTTGIGCFVALV